MPLLVPLLAWTGLVGLGAYVAAQKGRPRAEGALLGLLFGPLGCLVVALLPEPPHGPGPSRPDPPESPPWPGPPSEDDLGLTTEYVHRPGSASRGCDLLERIARGVTADPERLRREEAEALRRFVGRRG
jgi:hypothetical protein